MPLATALRSLVDSNQQNWPLSVYIMTDRFSEDGMQAVEDSLPLGSADFQWIFVDLQKFEAFSTLEHISRLTFARLILEKYVPTTIQRILYLDADLLVLKDLRPLWSSDMKGRCVVAVRDEWIDEAIKGRIKDDNGDDIPSVQLYFNAGVLLIDLPRWRQQQIGMRALNFLANNPKTRYADQDALNAVLDGDWTPIDGLWNFQGHIFTRIRSMNPKPAIVHFITGAKPWLYEHGTPNERLFDSYRTHTRYSRSVGERFSDLKKSLKVKWQRIIRRLDRSSAQARSI